MSARDELAALIDGWWLAAPVADRLNGLSRRELAVAIIKAGWVSAAEVKAARAVELRIVADYHDKQAGYCDGPHGDVLAMQHRVDAQVIRARAAHIEKGDV